MEIGLALKLSFHYQLSNERRGMNLPKIAYFSLSLTFWMFEWIRRQSFTVVHFSTWKPIIFIRDLLRIFLFRHPMRLPSLQIQQMRRSGDGRKGFVFFNLIFYSFGRSIFKLIEREGIRPYLLRAPPPLLLQQFPPSATSSFFDIGLSELEGGGGEEEEGLVC